jgi:alpha-mannosidase
MGVRLVSLWMLVLSGMGVASPVFYNTSSGVSPSPDIINVHIVSHTHDDTGWLKTVDQYFSGANSSIFRGNVSHIIESVIENLELNPDRRFIWVEQAFFQRWWRISSPEDQERVRRLVKSKQFEFTNGGWCMHDEATTHYLDMIDQTTYDHRFIKEQFDEVPRVTWQIDPFGHSSTQGSLLSAASGFDALFIARIDFMDQQKREAEQRLEFLWRPSRSLKAASEVFTSVMNHGYQAPTDFWFEHVNNYNKPPSVDDSNSSSNNVHLKVDQLVTLARERVKAMHTNHIMVALGDDFAYYDASLWFENLDKLIVSRFSIIRLSLMYSITPTWTVV